MTVTEERDYLAEQFDEAVKSIDALVEQRDSLATELDGALQRINELEDALAIKNEVYPIKSKAITATLKVNTIKR